MSAVSVLVTRASPWVVLACGVGALAARPSASHGALAVTLAVGLTSVWGGLSRGQADADRSLGRLLVIVLVGCGAFTLARWLRPGAPPIPLTLFSLVATIASAAAEELFFRNFVYTWLARWGSVVAIGGAALLFAIVHVPAYGIVALPIDLAAGAIFGWQRWASGGCTAPVVTHVVANILQFLP